MKIWDTFLFNRELDMLECRLTEMGDWPEIWRHVLVEAPVDHQGHAKPLYYAEHKERFAAWSDRIIHVVAEDLPAATATPLHWARERAQREQIGRGLGGADPADVLLLADVDEIPSRMAVERAAALRGPHQGGFVQTCAIFAVDLLWPDPMRTTTAATAGHVASFARVRERAYISEWIEGAGFHLTWLGGEGAVRAKLTAHCHTECNADVTEALGPDIYKRARNPFRQWSTEPLLPVDVGPDWPAWIRDRRCPPSWFRPRGDDGA